MVAVTEGKLDFGPWEQIFYGEFDGRRKSVCWLKLSANKTFKDGQQPKELVLRP